MRHRCLSLLLCGIVLFPATVRADVISWFPVPTELAWSVDSMKMVTGGQIFTENVTVNDEDTRKLIQGGEVVGEERVWDWSTVIRCDGPCPHGWPPSGPLLDMHKLQECPDKWEAVIQAQDCCLPGTAHDHWEIHDVAQTGYGEGGTRDDADPAPEAVYVVVQLSPNAGCITGTVKTGWGPYSGPVKLLDAGGAVPPGDARRSGRQVRVHVPAAWGNLHCPC